MNMSYRIKKKTMRKAAQKAEKALEDESERQCLIIFPCVAIALHRIFGYGAHRIDELLHTTKEVTNEISDDVAMSSLELLDKEVGIEMENGTGRKYTEIDWLNGDSSQRIFSEEEYIVMQRHKKDWVAPLILSGLFVGMHRRYGFGYERLQRLLDEVENVRAEYNGDSDKLISVCAEETGYQIGERLKRWNQ